MQKRFLFVASILLVLNIFSFAQQGASETYRKLTLEQCIDFAMKTSRSVQSAELDKESAIYKKREVFGTALPNAFGAADYTYYFDLPQSFVPSSFFGGSNDEYRSAQFGFQNNITASFEATQVLYNQSLIAGLKAASVSQELFALRLEKEKEDVVYNVSMVYYGIYVSNKQLENLNENLVTITRLIKIAEANYANGIITKTDYERIAVTRGNLETNIINLKTLNERQKNLLKLLLDVPVTTDVSIADSIAAGGSLDAGAMEESFPRTELKLLHVQKSLAVQEKRATIGQYVPRLSAFYSYSYNWISPDFKRTFENPFRYPVSMAGLSLIVPIFDGFSNTNRVKQNTVKIKKMGLQIEMLENDISMEIDNARNKLIDAQMALSNQEKNYRLSEKIYEKSNVQYREGTIPLTDLLNAESVMRESQRAYINALANLLMAEVDLRKANGNLLK